MKYIHFLLLLSLAACTRQPADHFVLRGTVPGAVDSTTVSLRISSGNGVMQKIESYIIGEKFELSGKVDAPTRSELFIDSYDIIRRMGKDYEMGRSCNIDFFVENGNLTFSTPHLDSLPQSYWRYDIRKEKNYRVKGSPAQDAYYEYQQQTLLLRHSIIQLMSKTDCTREEKRQMADLRTQLTEKGWSFVRNHSNLAAKLYVANLLKKNAFTYDQAYLDELEKLFASSQDTCQALKDFRQYLRDATRFVQGTPLQDGKITDAKGKTVSLLGQLNPAGYTVIDFWASWCAPCRASFPHLKEMSKCYGEKVKFLSISIDQKEEDWKEAMEEEKMPWPQFLCPTALKKELPALYDLRGVPTFFLIDPQGRIVFSGHDTDNLGAQLEKTGV